MTLLENSVDSRAFDQATAQARKAGWTEDQDNQLRELIGFNSRSFAEIGAVIGKSRAAVGRRVLSLKIPLPERFAINQMIRAKLKAEPGQSHEHLPRKRITRMVRSNGHMSDGKHFAPIVTPELRLRCVEIVPRNLTLLELEDNDCRFPYGEGTITFCGHPKLKGSAYCGPHNAICWVAPLKTWAAA